MRVNDILNIKIDKLVFGGEGMGKINDIVVFVPMSVPGDELEIKIISVKKTYARGLITRVIIPSPDRVSVDKISFEDYSGCDYGMMSYEAQIKNKEEIVVDLFKKLSKLDISKVEVVKSPEIKNYRNKVAEPFVKINGVIHTGFYKKKSHEIFISDTINLRSDIASDVTDKLLSKLNSYKGTKKEFKVHNDITNTGLLKNCVIRNNDKNEVMITIVVNSKGNMNHLIKVLEEFYDENDNVKSIYLSIKEKQDNVIFGETMKLIKGAHFITEEILGIVFKIYPDSFFQINKKQTLNLYSYAISLLGDYKDKTIIDAFSGTGTIAMLMASKAKKVIGIEMAESSVKSAILTAKENKIDNVKFVQGKVEEKISQVVKSNKIDYIVFDPPRKGIQENVLDVVDKNNIQKIIYISCDPSTLARDIQILVSKGYKLVSLKCFDMFPQTHHVESVALLEKIQG